MSSAVAELDGYLHSMLSLKPPGVSGSKINGITSLCTANVQVSHTQYSSDPPNPCMLFMTRRTLANLFLFFSI